MFLYFHVSEETAVRGLLTPTLLDLIDLWRRRFLPGNATVWMDADHDSGSFWALTDQSQFVQLITAGSSPGFVRVTRDLVRWARSFDDTTKSPLMSRDIKQLPGGDKTKVSVIVRHTCPSSSVTVIDGSTGKSLKPGPDGAVNIDRVAVIDWPMFSGKSFTEPTQFERIDAELHGMELICDTVEPDFAQFLRKHMSDYRIVIEDSYMKQIGGALEGIDGYGRFLAAEVFDNIQKLKFKDSAASPIG